VTNYYVVGLGARREFGSDENEDNNVDKRDESDRMGVEDGEYLGVVDLICVELRKWV
jgi:hypothetical protein